jgi:HEAT repeat protein
MVTGIFILGSVVIWYFYFTLPGLTQQLHSSSRDTRCRAASRLASRGPEARPALPILESMLDDTECMEFGHDALAEWVDQVGGTDAWFEVARKGGQSGRRQALMWLELATREHPERSQELKPLFAASLEDENGWIRFAAVRGLGSLRDKASEFVPELQRLLNDPEPMVRKQVVEALDKMHSLEGLQAAASNPDEEIRYLTMQHLQKQDGIFASSVEMYKEMINDPELSELGKRAMARHTAPPDPRDFVSYGQQALPILINALEDDSGRVSTQAAMDLWCMRRQALPALEALEKTAFNSANVQTRTAALAALAAIGPEGYASLRRAANDPDPQVRNAAVRTLELIDYQSRQ